MWIILILFIQKYSISMWIIEDIQIRKFFIKILLIITLCSFCLNVKAEETLNKESKDKKNVFKTIKEAGQEYRTKLEMKYYENLLKQEPKNIELLEKYGKYLKEHKYYDKSIKIYNILFRLTKDNKYKTEIAENKAYKQYFNLNKTFISLIEQGEEYESKGQIRIANEFYQRAFKIFPDRFEAKFGLAKTYGWLKDTEKSNKLYQDLLKEASNNVDLLEAYAGSLKDNGEYSKAIAIYNELFSLTKNSKYKKNIDETKLTTKGLETRKQEEPKKDKLFLDYIQQAKTYESKRNIKKANEYYLNAEKIAPNRYEAQFGLAKTYGWLGKRELAKSYYQKLLKLTPKNPDLIAAYNNFIKADQKKQIQQAKPISTAPDYVGEYLKQAQKLESLGKIENANEYYKKAQNIDASRYEVKFGLARTYGWMHKDDLAMKYYNELLKETPNNEALLENYAAFLISVKNYQKPMEIYQKLLAKTKDSKYNADIANIYFLQKDYEKSMKLYQELYEQNPNNSNVQKNIAFLSFISGDFAKAIEFYEKYFTQKSDPESIVIYGKCLFYSKQTVAAKKILEKYLKQYPNDTEALSVLADIYLSLKNPCTAKCLVNKALGLAPDKLSLKIQSAKVDMALKDYTCAEEKLLALLTTNPDNSEILENLGDINLYTDRPMMALGYYQSIENYRCNSRLKYKIAQGHHYNKDYLLGDYHYHELVRDPEYSRKARIGIAEIKIIQNKPLQARKILNRVLEEDPCNLQAKKNLAISWYTTGDNYKSLKILKSLPCDDDEINDIKYNMAKAYYKIERNDVALDLLENNPLKDAKTLRGEIKMISRPAISPLYDNYYMSPSNGSANAGKYQKAGGAFYYYFRPNFRMFATSQAAQYANITNLVSTTAIINNIGVEGQVNDHLNLRSTFGVEAFSNGPAIFLGSAIARYAPNDFMTWTSGYIRSLDEIDSYMSAAGVIPSTGPFANQLVGRIIDNKYMLFNLGFKLPHKAYAYVGMNVGNKYGSNSPSNFYREIMWGLGKIFYSAAEKKPVNQVLFGYDFYYTGYNYDRSGFGGANLDYSPIGSDGQATDPSTGFPGTGGYFSPTFFLANKFPITFKGTFKDTKLKYLLSAFIGTQTIQGQIGLLGPTPGGTSEFITTPYFGYSVGLRYNEKGRFSAGVDYIFNNYMTVAQHLFKAFLLYRF